MTAWTNARMAVSYDLARRPPDEKELDDRQMSGNAECGFLDLP